MSLTKFLIRTIIKGSVLLFLIIILSTTTMQAVSPIISNEIALGQMQNSDVAFVLMNTYCKARPLIRGVIAGIMIWLTATIGCDTYKFVKTIETEREN